MGLCEWLLFHFFLISFFIPFSFFFFLFLFLLFLPFFSYLFCLVVRLCEILFLLFWFYFCLFNFSCRFEFEFFYYDYNKYWRTDINVSNKDPPIGEQVWSIHLRLVPQYQDYIKLRTAEEIFHDLKGHRIVNLLNGIERSLINLQDKHNLWVRPKTNQFNRTILFTYKPRKGLVTLNLHPAHPLGRMSIHFKTTNE